MTDFTVAALDIISHLVSKAGHESMSYGWRLYGTTHLAFTIFYNACPNMIMSLTQPSFQLPTNCWCEQSPSNTPSGRWNRTPQRLRGLQRSSMLWLLVAGFLGPYGRVTAHVALSLAHVKRDRAATVCILAHVRERRHTDVTSHWCDA